MLRIRHDFSTVDDELLGKVKAMLSAFLEGRSFVVETEATFPCAGRKSEVLRLDGPVLFDDGPIPVIRDDSGKWHVSCLRNEPLTITFCGGHMIVIKTALDVWTFRGAGEEDFIPAEKAAAIRQIAA